MHPREWVFWAPFVIFLLFIVFSSEPCNEARYKHNLEVVDVILEATARQLSLSREAIDAYLAQLSNK